MDRGRPGVGWDPHAYNKVGTPQQEWALELLSRIRLRGDETVIDLGCGVGHVAAALAQRLPRGQVVAVDASAAMVRAAAERLGPKGQAVQADIATFTWPQPADLVVSTAALHWVPDHATLWRRLHMLLRPQGQLSVQYGGAGNIPGVEDAMRAVASRRPFSPYLEPFSSPWTFDAPTTAVRQLRDAGFREVDVWTECKQARPRDMRDFTGTAIVVETAVGLPTELRALYAEAVYEALGAPEELAYVRLNAEARA